MFFTGVVKRGKMAKKSKCWRFEFIIFYCIIFLFLIGLGWAATFVLTANPSSTVEDVTTNYNITINMTDGVEGNVTEVNITLPSGFTFLSGSNSSETASANFTNSSSTQLSWVGFAQAGLINGTGIGRVLFNATATNPGTFNFTVIVTNFTSSSYSNLSVTVNDTTVPATITYGTGTENDESNFTRTSIVINVTATDNGVINTILIRLYNSTHGQINSSSNITASTHFINFTGLSEGLYRFNATVNDSYGNSNSTATRIVRIDNTPPVVFAANISSPTNNGNYSGNNLLLNVSIVDATLLVQSVFFNVTNSSGAQNNTFTATKEGAGNAFSTYLNTTNFRDGVFNITVWANDTVGNLNNSARITVTFDNTAPNVSTPVSPVSGGNYSGTFIFNVSINDATLSVRSVFFNVTNSSGAQNATFTASNPTGNYWNASINTAAFPDGIYNITIYANDTLGNLNSSIRVSTLTFDNIVSTISFGVGTENDGVNVSRNWIYANVTYNETNFGNITFSLYNDTATVNSTLFTSATYTINWTNLSNGNYTYQVNITDSANSKNSTGTRRITLDTVAPTVAQTCSPTSPTIGETLTCSCSASDATSGVQTGPTYTVNPSTGSTGTYTTSCSATDYAGNTGSDSDQYTVEGGGSSSSGGGGGGGGGETSWTKTIPSSSDESKKFNAGEPITANLGEKTRKTFTTKDNKKHHVGITKIITITSIEVEVASTPQKVIFTPGMTKKFELTGDNYNDLSVTLKSITNRKADLTIMAINELIPLPPEPEPVVEEEPEEVEPPVIAQPEEEAQPTSSKKIWVTVIIILILIVAAAIIIKKRGNKKEKRKSFYGFY